MQKLKGVFDERLFYKVSLQSFAFVAIFCYLFISQDVFKFDLLNFVGGL